MTHHGFDTMAIELAMRLEELTDNEREDREEARACARDALLEVEEDES